MGKPKKPKTIEDRLVALESILDKYRPIWDALAKEYDLAKPRVNPEIYCKDDLDRQIIAYLIEHGSGATSEVAEAVGLENPKNVGRHTIGKRIIRIKKLAERDHWDILEFHPENKEGKFRAWWLNLAEVDIAKFKIDALRE